MGITASYARVGAAELERIRTEPDHYWQLREMPWDLSESTGPADSERLYVDKDWEVLSWLCSPLGRAEARHLAGLIRVDMSIKDDDEFKAALAKAVAALGLSYVDPKTLPEDAVLDAIQGRQQEDKRIADLGLSAAVFAPEEVDALLSALSGVSESNLRADFDVKEIEALQLPGDWDESELDEFYLPQLNRIKTLYSRAASARQHVIVVMS